MADLQLSANVYVRDNNYDTATLRQWAAEALSRMTVSIDTLLPGGRVDVVFLPPHQIQGGGGWGYTTPSARVCTVNNGLTRNQTEYTMLHEISHVIDPDMLDHAAKVTLAGLMSPAVATGAAGFWNSGTVHNAPAECFANTFPQAYSDIGDQAGSFYTRTIASGSFATYRATLGGSAPPTSMTLAANASAGDTNLKYTGATTGLTVGDWIQVGTGSGADVVQISAIGTSGSGGTGISFSPALLTAHGSGATVVETSEPPYGTGNGGAGPTYSITIAGIDFTQRVDPASIRLSEVGSDAVATLEFSIESGEDDTPYGGFVAGQEFPSDAVIVQNLTTGWRYFGGVLTGSTRRHGEDGLTVFQDVRCVSYDSWLDRRFLPQWWTTKTGTSSGNKLADDKLIVQQIILSDSAGKVGGGVGLIANDTFVKSTNTTMPKLNLSASSLRDMIRATGEAAATDSQPTARRCYVDFYKRVHYFKGNESLTAPYIVGDASYGRYLGIATGLVSYWPFAEGSGATCYDSKRVADITLNSYYLRGIPAGVVNQPQSKAVYLGGTGYGQASSASLHPGNTFSFELWFQRGKVGSEQTLVDAGTGDYVIEFQANDTLRVYKKGTGADFITNATFTDTNWHHLVVTHSGSATHVYVDGVDKAGTATLKTMVPTVNALYIGQLSDGTLHFSGSLQHLALYSIAMTGAQILTHYNWGMTVVPDYIDFDVDYNDSVSSVYVQGANAGGTGWSYDLNGKGIPPVSPYGANTVIDRSDSDAAATRVAIQIAYLHREGAPVKGGHITLSGYDGWRVGQTLTVADAGLGINGTWEIMQIDTGFSGTGDVDYDIYFGALPWRGSFDLRRKGHRNSISSAQPA